MRNSIFTAAALAALAALPGAAAAQSNTAQLTATAEVLAPIDVAFVSDLVFGDVLPGVPSQVLPAAGGQFTVSGATDQNVILDFALPATLTAGALTLPVAFDAGYGVGAPDNAIDPSTDPTVNLGAGGALDVFLGGTVTPAVDQGAGSYSGTVTLTVTYPTT